MITQVTHMTVYVLDQNRALDFYTNKLGFRVVTDVPMSQEARWLTVSPPQQPGLEIVLSPVSTAMFKQETVDVMTELVRKGTFGVAVLTCDDIYATYEEMTAKGVEFTKAPKKEFYGTEAIFKDDSGNWFSLAQLT
ncbi:VOC family protein [Chitinophaga varians]|uniref:VOC family protein n=1 Tax=Chitinophaga varians TaxID=2202339 RepID=A0A847RL82_9BACT|nr:VOC family protein [Chitinophaga varians]NLR63896.1 VOC family protein [Chitinophaga varians]